MNLDEYRELKKKVDKLQQRKLRAEGALDGLLKRLEDDFGVSTPKEAEKKLAELEKEAKRAEERAERAFDEFREKWDEKLQEA